MASLGTLALRSRAPFGVQHSKGEPNMTAIRTVFLALPPLVGATAFGCWILQVGWLHPLQCSHVPIFWLGSAFNYSTRLWGGRFRPRLVPIHPKLIL